MKYKIKKECHTCLNNNTEICKFYSKNYHNCKAEKLKYWEYKELTEEEETDMVIKQIAFPSLENHNFDIDLEVLVRFIININEIEKVDFISINKNNIIIFKNRKYNYFNYSDFKNIEEAIKKAIEEFLK